MEMMDSSDENLRRAGAAIAEGKLVVIPTETVYGLGADAFNPDAVARVFEAKMRPAFDPLIVHISTLDDIERIATSFPPKARLLAEILWPGPLTMILPKRPEVPDIVTSGLGTVAVRFPAHPVARKIIEYSGTVVAAPSANPFGYISPTTARHVAKTLGDRVDFIVDGGPCAVGVESTVIDMTRDTPALLRPGGMPLERIRDIIGEVLIPGKKGGPIASPGQLKSHYAPRANLYLYDWNSLPGAIHSSQSGAVQPGPPSGLGLPGRVAAIVFDGSRASKLAGTGLFRQVCALSERGDMREAASRLFALLHELDTAGFAAIYAERVPEEGLGRAINDRLYRASKK
ncbi:MAG TPA: L-threonylcarbamoyladenylate synthase [Rectinemataceae bacterium]|nr:L-threonylcarbamoyladenylate synthase [Rectinemataceae bacterium]